MSCVAKRTRSHTQKEIVAKKCKVVLEQMDEKCSTTILNLNDDCLEAVFLYLSQKDLINVFDSKSKFRIACERAFKRNYAKIPTTVSNIQGNRVNCQVTKRSIRLLQIFGHLITKLVIEFKLDKIETLLEAIGDHCGDTVNQLEFCHIGIRVKEPSIRYDIGLQTLDLFLQGIDEKFPNLNSLRFDYRNTSKMCPYFKNINRHIPSLTSLSVVGPLFSLEELYEILESNSQLDSLTLIGEPNGFIETSRSFFITEDFVRVLNVSSPQLKHLEVSCVSIDEMTMITGKRFENLKSLKFGSFCTNNRPERGYLAFLGENVEDVTLTHFEKGTSTFVNNISKFKKLKRLCLHLTTSVELLGNIFVNLVQADTLVWSPEGIRQLIRSNKQLEEIIIWRHRTNEVFYEQPFDDMKREYLDLVKNKINGAKWNLKVAGKCYVLTKEYQK